MAVRLYNNNNSECVHLERTHHRFPRKCLDRYNIWVFIILSYSHRPSLLWNLSAPVRQNHPAALWLYIFTPPPPPTAMDMHPLTKITSRPASAAIDVGRRNYSCLFYRQCVFPWSRYLYSNLRHIFSIATWDLKIAATRPTMYAFWSIIEWYSPTTIMYYYFTDVAESTLLTDKIIYEQPGVWHGGWIQSKNVFWSQASARISSSLMGDHPDFSDKSSPHIHTCSYLPYPPHT